MPPGEGSSKEKKKAIEEEGSRLQAFTLEIMHVREVDQRLCPVTVQRAASVLCSSTSVLVPSRRGRGYRQKKEIY